MQEQSKKVIESLQTNLKMQEDLLKNEKNQLYEFIEKLTLDFKDISDKHDLKIEIPSKFKLIIN